jgi:hypothetical protein
VRLNFTTELKVPPERAFASLVDAFARDAARRGELEAEQEERFATAAGRGFSVIVEQALAESREAIALKASGTPLDVTLSFFERGLPMDDALARRDPGWSELAANVDAAHWRVHGTAGSELRLIARRPFGVSNDAAALPATDDVPTAPEQHYTIRRFVPADAIGVARAFYSSYGYAYDVGAVYLPARLIELNESGNYNSIVAVGADGEIAGHYALARDGGEPIADACGAIVLPAHRGRNLLNLLRDEAERRAIALGLAAYYSEPVTDHPRTQRASESFGAKACGITLGEAPRSFVARHMELTTTTQRQSCMLYLKPLQARERRTIFPPSQHRAMTERIYAELGLPVAIGEAPSPTGRGIVRTGITRRDAIGTVVVESIGETTADQVRQAVDDLRAVRRLGAIYLSLPLEQPGTPTLCNAMESCGFFFSSVGPWMLDGKDMLRLQMPLTPIDLSAVIVVGDFGKMLLDYIASERTRCHAGNVTRPR